MCNKILTNLRDFAYIPWAWPGMLDYLEGFALKEKWKFENVEANKNIKNPILENYIMHTFGRLATERNMTNEDTVKNSQIYIDDNMACFNTGLFTKNYKYIYAYFEKNKEATSALDWVLKGFFDDGKPELMKICELPTRAEYFSDISDLIYDTKLILRVNSAHILDNPTNKERIPESLRSMETLPMLFDGEELGFTKYKKQLSYFVEYCESEDKNFIIDDKYVDLEPNTWVVIGAF
ncbi:DUF3825 domain-containing protein [Clostridium algoriphilum]|uniref:DUF3825 domain-containing protein n=1 Tax=Clostridium algoriphilum TaxID=198347 RepID=UPI001CF3D982|nr:DUF3825 domain-containing protein [Clostridium algoriphilum]MCB2295713.1 DUF3825 domain-containing protein [Clostridium algoriphilum]